MGLGEEEDADLGDVGAGGDVDEVVFVLGIEGIVAGESRGGRCRPPGSPRGLRGSTRCNLTAVSGDVVPMSSTICCANLVWGLA